jgi:Predicted integral membrane protein
MTGRTALRVNDHHVLQLPPELTPEAVRAQCEKMLASDLFSRSERMSRFLRFTVEQSLAGNAANLKEYLIGVEVFDKPETLDPRLDPIVRVEAGRLRAKLREYYDTEGREDPILIHFPPRSYVPSFERRNIPALEPLPRVNVRKASDPGSPPAIAVLPFTDMSRSRDQEYFCDGLTEEIICTLSKLNPLRVVSRTSSFQFKGKADDIRHIGEQLNVNTVLEGSVRRDEKKVRITVQLVDTSDGYHVWSETFDRVIEDDILGLQHEISLAVAARLKESLSLTCGVVQ